MLIDRRIFRHFDWGLLFVVLTIPLFGMLVLYSAGYDPDSQLVSIFGFQTNVHSPAFFKQIVFFSVGLFAFAIGSLLPPQIFHKYAYVLFGGSILLLIIVLKAGVVVNGSRRWFNFGGFNLQPAEFVKLALIFALARFLSKTPPKPGGYGLLNLVLPSLFFLIPMALIMKQPDLGTALVIGAIGVLMLLFIGVNPKALITILVVFGVSILPAWKMLHDYQQRRVLVLFNPEADPLGSGYHITQSKIAVGSGSLFGKGYLKGTQTQLEFLPEHTTDFVFSVLAEEWGFFGCVGALALYFWFFYRLLRVVRRSRDLFSVLFVFGITSLFFFHVVINVGMVVGILPVVGIPLPLISYGGSSIISSLFALGIVFGISVRRGVFTS